MNLVQPLASRPQVVATAPALALRAEAIEGAALHGKETLTTATQAVLEQLPWHDKAARLLADGMRNKDVAAICDCQTQYVSKLLRTPWFQELMEKYMDEAGGSILTLFRAASTSAYVTLVDIMEDTKASKRDRITCAQTILDRHLGKATQVLEHKPAEAIADPVARYEELQRQLKLTREAEALPLAPLSDGSQLPPTDIK